MGVISSSIDNNLLDLIASEQAFDVFVETGTFKGDTVTIAERYFSQIYSIELSESYYKEAKARFKKNKKIQIIHGDAVETLKTLTDQFSDKKVLFWLDAHWCVADKTAKTTSQCNVCDELAAIGNLNEDSIVIIDDARLFLCSPPQPHEISQWPSLQSILKSLKALSDKHHLTIVNDNIIFYPHHLQEKLHHYAYNHGVDWLNLVDKGKQYDNFLLQLIDKEKEINNLLAICKERENVIVKSCGDDSEKYSILIQQLSEKEELINKLNSIVGSATKNTTDAINIEILKRLNECKDILLANKKNPLYRTGKIIRSQLRGFILKGKTYFRSDLGQLYQYPAKSPSINERYKKTLNLSFYPRISIVTPSYNQAQYIGKTINSILDQKYPNLQYIIQDGNSKDRTKDILNYYHSQLTHWESVPDKGQSNAINIGFKHTDGELMAYLNSDDLLLPGSLHYIADFFMKNPDVDVVYGHRILIDKNDLEIGRWILPWHSKKVLHWADYIPQETLFWRRSLWEKIGGQIDENFQFAMDWDLILRFSEAGAKFKRLPRFLGAFRVHDQQKTSAVINDKGVKEMDILRERCHGRKVSRKEIHKGIRGYQIKSLIYQKLYGAGLLKY